MRLLALGNLAKEELGTALRQRGAVLLWRGIAGLCFVAIAIIGLISLHRLISEHYGPYWADGALAGLFAIIALVALAVAMEVERRAKRRQVLATTMLAAAGLAAEALPDKKSTTQALVIAALAGGFWFARRH
jgi:chromate transport protein ChrA